MTKLDDAIVESVNTDGVSAPTKKSTTVTGSGLRPKLPILGLKEYWYPAIKANKVQKKKPTTVRLLGENVTFFHGRDGIAAVSNICPHRGGYIGNGRCHFAGTVTCPYHGWVFDETGACVAVLGEGPDSAIPGRSAARIDAYPTRTLKGIVFVWMGDGEPAPIEEDVPPEFFDEKALVLSNIDVWEVNWRPSVENYGDAHVFFVHRNSLRLMNLSTSRVAGMMQNGRTRTRPQVINNRALVTPFIGNTGESKSPAEAPKRKRKWLPKSAIEEHYEGLGIWPKANARWIVSLIATAIRRPPPLPRLMNSLEWSQMHLPGIMRTDNSSYLFSRTIIPVDENLTRMFYYHTFLPKHGLKRLFNIVSFYAFFRWYSTENFSGQDQEITQNQDYDKKEYLSSSDMYPLEWRKLVIRYARGTGTLWQQEHLNQDGASSDQEVGAVEVDEIQG